MASQRGQRGDAQKMAALAQEQAACVVCILSMLNDALVSPQLETLGVFDCMADLVEACGE